MDDTVKTTRLKSDADRQPAYIVRAPDPNRGGKWITLGVRMEIEGRERWIQCQAAIHARRQQVGRNARPSAALRGLRDARFSRLTKMAARLQGGLFYVSKRLCSVHSGHSSGMNPAGTFGALTKTCRASNGKL